MLFRSNAEGAIISALFFMTGENKTTGSMELTRTGYYESQAVRTKAGWKLKHHMVHLEGGITATAEPRWPIGPVRKGLR